MNKTNANRPADATPQELEMIERLEKIALEPLDKSIDEIIAELWP